MLQIPMKSKCPRDMSLWWHDTPNLRLHQRTRQSAVESVEQSANNSMRTVSAYVLHYSFQAFSEAPFQVEKYATTSTTISAVFFCFWVSYKSFLPSDVLLQICHEMHLKDADLSTSDANVQAQPDIFPSGEHITAGFTNPTESTQVSHQCLICWFQPFRLFVSELESSQNSAGSCGSFRNRNHQPAMP